MVTSNDAANVAIDEAGITKEVVVGNKFTAKANAKALTKSYTGEPIELTEEDMGSVIVKDGKIRLVYGEDFEIVGYADNVKKGKMTVYIAGTGEKFSGYASFKVSIVAKSMS